MTKKDTTLVDFTKKTAEELFELVGIKATVSVSDASSSDEEALKVEIDVENEAGLLIGSHGTTLAAIQSFLGMSIRQNFSKWVRVDVDVAGWKDKQEEHLQSLAMQTAERVKATGESQPLYNLDAAQRRIVHMALSKDPQISTESQGEGEERYLLVKLKKD